MLRELLALFGSQRQDQAIADELSEMIDSSVRLVHSAGDRCLARAESPAEFSDIRSGDKAINRLQRSIRKRTFVEMAANSGTGGMSLSFGVSIMNIVKDVERIGDYAKDLGWLVETVGPLPPGRELMERFASTVGDVDQWLGSLTETMASGDQVRAVHLIDRGRDLRGELREVQRLLLTEEQTNLQAPAETMAAQIYIRITSHALNVLSTLVTPLHRMDSVKKKSLLPEVKEKLRDEDG